MSPLQIPSVTVTPDPFSVVLSYEQYTKQSTSCVSLVSGQMGSVDATYGHDDCMLMYGVLLQMM